MTAVLFVQSWPLVLIGLHPDGATRLASVMAANDHLHMPLGRLLRQAGKA
jgi:hypothetical protein